MFTVWHTTYRRYRGVVGGLDSTTAGQRALNTRIPHAPLMRAWLWPPSYMPLRPDQITQLLESRPIMTLRKQVTNIILQRPGMKTCTGSAPPTLTNFEKNQLFDLRPDLPHT